MKKNKLYKVLATGIFILLIGVSITPSIVGNKIPDIRIKNKCLESPFENSNEGSLSGYVYNNNSYPIKGARVRVSFHETYEEDYSDENGYYHVTNIPICYCLKNASCSKICYTEEWVLLGIVENTTYDFILNTTNHPPSKPDIIGPRNVNYMSVKSKNNDQKNFPPETHGFRFRATDPDGDNIRYHIDWDDGDHEITGFYPSGEEITVNHSYNAQGSYTVRAKAEDPCGFFGPIGTIDIPIMKIKDYDCLEMNSRYYVKLGGLLNRLKFYLSMFQIIYNDKVEIVNKCQNILKIIDSYGFWEDFCNTVSNLAQYIQDLINNNGGIFKLLSPLFAGLISIWMIFCWLY
jgi:hypothetical protein